MKLFKQVTHETTNDLVSIVFTLLLCMIIAFTFKHFTDRQLATPKEKNVQIKKVEKADNPGRVKEAAISTKAEIYYNISLSKELQDFVKDNCKTIKPELVFAVMDAESSFNPKAQNGKCIGLMQIHECNFKWLAEVYGLTNLWDEKQNIKAGIIMLEYLDGTYLDNHMTLTCYNNGEKGADRDYFSKGIFQSDYSIKVIKRIEELEVTK